MTRPAGDLVAVESALKRLLDALNEAGPIGSFFEEEITAAHAALDKEKS